LNRKDLKRMWNDALVAQNRIALRRGGVVLPLKKKRM
jgi:hypothetical protein